MLAGIIVAGWDEVNGGQVFSIPLGGRGEYCADLSDLDSDPKTCKIDSLDIRGKPQGLTSPDTNLYQGVL